MKFLRLSAQSLVSAIGFAVLATSTSFALSTPTTPATGAIAAGYVHTVTLKSDGTVWTWGENAYGRLGDGTTTSRTTAVQVSGLTDVVAVSAGYYHSVALKRDGTVWTWGGNGKGQLGNGTTVSRTTPIQIAGLNGIVAVEAGHSYTVSLKDDGTVWAWGDNAFGQLGDGTNTQRTTAVQMSGVNNVVGVVAGNSHTVVLKNDGTVWACGRNLYGEVGDGTLTQRSTAVALNGLSGVVSIAVGSYHSFALKSDGTVLGWGDNSGGKLGNGTWTNQSAPVTMIGMSGAMALAAGLDFSMILKSDGAVWTCGSNLYGQLGNGLTSGSPTTIAIQVNGITGATAISANGEYGAVLKTDGTILSWGSNTRGQLGDGTTSYRNTTVAVSGLRGVAAVAAGSKHTVALKNDGTVWAWGYGAGGMLGDNSSVNSPTPVSVIGMKNVAGIAAGNLHSVALKIDGTVWGWGYNNYGQLGDGTTNFARPTAVQAIGLTGIVAIAAGSNHTVALKNDGTVWVWGSNNAGQLGDGTKINRNTPISVNGVSGIIAVAAGLTHTLALKNDGTVWAWGDNTYGQLGIGTTTSGSGLAPAQVVDLNGIVSISGGYCHSVALMVDGSVWAWGANTSGQIGDGTTITRTKPVRAAGLDGVVAVGSGASHTVALKADGSVWNWGYNYYGQLADGTYVNRRMAVQANGLGAVVQIAAGECYTVALTSDGTLRGWGDNTNGQLAFASWRPTRAAIRLIASAADADQDGMDDVWELQYFGDLGQGGNADADGDGLTDIQEFDRGTDPTEADTDGDGLSDFVDSYANDFYNGVTPSISVVGGDNQSAAPHAFNAMPLDVAVWNVTPTAPLANAPVSFSVTSGEGALASSITGDLLQSLTVRSDQDGTAQVYFKHGASYGVSSTISVVAGNARMEMRSTTISQQSQTITFDDPGTQTYGAPLTLNAAASSGLPVTFAATSGPVTIANGVATFTGIGSVTITAVQAGDSTYSAAPGVARTFDVVAAGQPTVTLSPSIVTINAGEAVSFTASGGMTNYVWGGSASGSGATQSVTFGSAGTFSVTAYAMAEGNYAQSNTATATITVRDSTPPVIAPQADIIAEATSAAGAEVTFGPSATDAVDGPVAVVASPVSGSMFAPGTNTVMLTATDAAGNTATSSFTVTVRDTTAPTIALPANQTLEATGPDGAIATFSASASDLVSGSVAVIYSSASGGRFALGANTVTVTATDAAGNTATGTFTVTVLDTTGPVITVPETITAEATSDAGATVALVGSATDLVSGTVPVTFSPATNTRFPLGETTVTATATDAAGNNSTATLVVKVVDTLAPVLTLPADITAEASGPAGAAVTFSAHAADAVNGDLGVSYSTAPGSTFPLGQTAVTVTAADVAGNVVTGSFKITVVDTTAPTITVPANQTLEATGAAGAIATFDASASDVVDGAVAVVCSGASGSFFALGANTVTLTATDAAGNSATRTFTISVRDTTAPTLSLPANIAQGATDQNGAVVNYDTSASDLVDGNVSVVASIPSGSVFPIGNTSVSVTATDAAGNTATGSFAVSVGMVSPSISTPPVSQTVAVGAPVTFSVGAVGTRPFAYQWRKGSTVIAGATGATYTIPSAQTTHAGSYSVVVSNPAGSMISGAATLSVKTPPSITTQPVKATVTAGRNATFRVVASGSTTLRYQWYFNGSAISAATAASFTITAAQSANAGSYAVVVSNDVGSVTSTSVTLTVNNPVVITTQPANQSITVGSPVTFSVAASGTAPFSYQWRRNGTAIAGATSSSYTIPAAQTAHAGSYSVVVANVVGSIASSTAVLKVNVPPAITTQPVSKTVVAGTTVTFKVVATGTATLTYQWSRNGAPIAGATSASYTVVANIATAGTYTVVVRNVAGSMTSSPAALTLK